MPSYRLYLIHIYFSLALINVSLAQDCSVLNENRNACGPDESTCNSRDCCWREPDLLLDVPWCFFPANSQCNVPGADKNDCGWTDITEQECYTQSCCWAEDPGYPYCFSPSSSIPSDCDVPRDQKIDCGGIAIQEQECLDMGCCWAPIEGDPWCFRKGTSCDTDPCVNGQCWPYYDDYYCECYYGYEGKNCDILQEICEVASKQPCNIEDYFQCLRYGCCYDESSEPKCYKSNALPEGPTDSCDLPSVSSCGIDDRRDCLFSGCCWSTEASDNQHCYEPTTGNCVNHDCTAGHGVCVPTETGYTCDCHYGYTGPTCDSYLDVCTDLGSNTKVRCNSGGETDIEYICDRIGCCFDNSESPYCYHSIGDPIGPPGIGNDLCLLVDNNKKIDCGFAGISMDECLQRPGCCWDTFNEDTNQPSDVWCFRADYCSLSPCKNNGTCLNHEGGYVCVCTEEWQGQNCSIAVAPTVIYSTRQASIPDWLTEEITMNVPLSMDYPSTTRSETTSRIPQTTTVLTDKDPPYFKIDLSGAFYSYEREDFSPYCTEELGSVMESKAQSMISPVNSRIGVEFCLDKTTADILVISTASTISTSGMEGLAANSFVMRIGLDQRIEDVYGCVVSVSGFVENHLNWGVPILPPPDDCPLPVFYSNHFDNVGNYWICPENNIRAKVNQRNNNEEQLKIANNTLGYEISLAGEFVTYNGIPMDSQCTAAYSNQFLQETLQMVTQVNSLIGNQLCSNYPGMVLSTATSSLASDGIQGSTTSSFLASLDDSMYFDWVSKCGQELSIYMQDFDKWGTPILEQVPGCPLVIFQGNGFEENGQKWICV